MNNILLCSIAYAGEFILETAFLQNSALVNYKFNLLKSYTVNDITEDTVIIMIVRETAECAAFICDKYNPSDIQTFLIVSEEISQLKNSYINLKYIYQQYKKKCVVINYNDIINDPNKVMNSIHTLFKLPKFNYDLEFIKYVPVIDSKKILGEFFDDYDQTSFWDDSIKKPEKDLERQLKYSLIGDFDNAKKLVNKLEIEQPSNHRAAFNRGWFKMMEGNLLEGQRLLDRGRFVNVFGNPKITNRPIWSKKQNMDIVLFFMEGGLGDQIHAFRYVNILKTMCKELIVSCEKSLVDLFVAQNLKIKIIKHEDLIFYQHYDSWIPSMSVITILEYEYTNIQGAPYISAINKPISTTTNKKTIGLKWSGNPKFEHQQYRKFPLPDFFNSVYNEKFNYISLQRDEESDKCPMWVKQVNLNTWIDTKAAIESCDLVVSSCTSVAHLAGAIGKQTYILIPILPYYLWALPGETTPYYNSVKLIRQVDHTNWETPFKQLKKYINEY